MTENTDVVAYDAPAVPVGTPPHDEAPAPKPKKKAATTKPSARKAKVAKKKTAKANGKGKKPSKGKVKKVGKAKRGAMVSRGVNFAHKSALAKTAHGEVVKMLSKHDPDKVAAKFGKSKSWLHYIKSGRTTLSLETIDALAKGLGYQASFTIRKKGK
jgi:transcriptional regulator with XRE-family HTH domain